MIELKNITKKYDEKVVFQNFNLTFFDEITCILGVSGCGKTTLLNILGSQIAYDGTITALPQNVSYIFQKDRLLANLTAIKNIEYVLGAMHRNQRRQVAEKYLRLVELYEFRDKYPRELSGGMAQRVSMARAYAYPSQLLLMDEPFRNLDIALKYRLMKVFCGLYKSNPRMTVFVTHDIEEALTIAHRIVIIDRKQILRDIKLEGDIMRKPDENLREEIKELLIAL